MKRAIILGHDKEGETNTLLLSRAKSLFESLEPHNNNGQVSLKRVVSHLSECHEQTAVDVLREKNPDGDFSKITQEEVIQLCQRFGLSLAPVSSQNKRKHAQNHKHHGGVSHQNPPQMTFAFAGNQTIVYSCGNQISFVTAFKQYDELDTLRILCENGYGLDPLKNAKLMLAKKNNISFRRVSPDLWQWVSMMKEEYLLKVNSSQQGKSMQPPHQETELCNMQDILKNKSGNSGKYSFYYHRVIESKERIQCLKILKWSPLPLSYSNQDSVSDILLPYLNQLEAENQLFRASAIAAFHFDFARALDLLNKSQPDDEQIHAVKLLKSILAALKIIQQNVQNDNTLKQRLENGSYPTKDSSLDITPEDTSRAKNCNFLHIPGLTGSAVATAAQNLSNNFKNIPNSNLRYNLIQVQINFLSSLLKESSFTHPYLNVLAVFLCGDSGNDGRKELWEMAELEMFDRIALALRFADDDILSAFISSSITQSINNGQLECLVLVDRNEQAIQILQAYIDATGDIQTTGLLSAYLLLLGYAGKEELLRWYKNYKNILNRVNIFDKRNFLDKEFKNLSTQFGVKIDPQQDFSTKVKHHSIDSRSNCPSCCDFNAQFKAITKSQVQKSNMNTSSTSLVPRNAIAINNNNGSIDQTLDLSLNSAAIGVCNNCAQFLPTCCVCLLSCELPNPYLLLTSRARQMTATSSSSSAQAQAENLNLEDGILWCQSCGHGGHYKHILEWFNDYELCSVSDCSCKCSVI